MTAFDKLAALVQIIEAKPDDGREAWYQRLTDATDKLTVGDYRTLHAVVTGIRELITGCKDCDGTGLVKREITCSADPCTCDACAPLRNLLGMSQSC